MSIDIKLNQNKGYWDVDFADGDFQITDSLDTAIYMSVFCDKRATQSQVSEPSLRRGHFTNMFNNVNGYEIGSLLWLYTSQAKNTTYNLSSIENAVSEGLKWLIEDNIVNKIEVVATKENSQVKIAVKLINNLQSNAKYYNLFYNL